MISASTSGRFAADLAFRERIRQAAEALWPQAVPVRVFHSREPGAHYALRLPQAQNSLPRVDGMSVSAEGGFVNLTLVEESLQEGLALLAAVPCTFRDDAFSRRLRALMVLRPHEALWGAEAERLAWTLIDPYTKKERVLRDFEAWFRAGHLRRDMLAAALAVWSEFVEEEET